MFCQNCGKEISENAKFCANCGTKIEISVTENITVQNDTEELKSLNKPGEENCKGEDVSSAPEKQSEREGLFGGVKYRVSWRSVIILLAVCFILFILLPAFGLIEVVERGFDNSIGHCNISIYYTTIKYSKNEINSILDDFNYSDFNDINSSANMYWYSGISKTYMVGIEKSLLGTNVEAYCSGTNNYKETLFSNTYSNYNEAKDKFDSLRRKCFIKFLLNCMCFWKL